MTGLQPDGLSHSEISGSRVICTLPELIAAYHVLRRLREPRHPPAALDFFSYAVLFLKNILATRYSRLSNLTSWFSICNRFVSVCQRSSLSPLNAEWLRYTNTDKQVRLSKTNLSIVKGFKINRTLTVRCYSLIYLDLADASVELLKEQPPLLDVVDYSLRFRRQPPKRSCSSRTFRYGYLVTT